MGRKDCTESDLPPEGLLPSSRMTAAELKAAFERQGFSEEEMVALMGSHTIRMALKEA